MGIVVEHIKKGYEGKVVLDGISLEIHDGEFVTFLAPTGEGKTTLLRIMAGIERPDSGRIYFNGVDVTDLPVQKKSIAMVYQWFVNYPSLTVYENIASPLRVSREKLPASEIDRRVRETAKLLKITEILDHHPSEISGGQQQRLAIARALAKGSDFIFLDEPLTNLDYKLREELRVELKKIFAAKPGAVVFATPEPTDALALSTHVGFLHRGRLLQYGPAEEVYNNPMFIEVGAYFSHTGMNIFACDLVSQDSGLYLRATDDLKVSVGPFRDVLKEGRYYLGIRANSLSTERECGDMFPIRATLELSEVVGSDTELHLRHQGIPLIALMQRVARYEIGEEITVYVHPHRFYIYSQESGRLVAKTMGS